MDINDIIESLTPEERERIERRTRTLIEEEVARRKREGELWREYLEGVITRFGEDCGGR
jgi:hypothetical protein